MHLPPMWVLWYGFNIMFSLMLLLYSVFGQAQEPKPTILTEIRIDVGDKAEVRTFPKIQGTLVELRITHCTTDIEEIVQQIRRPHVRNVRAINIGEESWLLRMELIDEEYDVDATVVDGYLNLHIIKAEDLQGRQSTALTSTKMLFDDMFGDTAKIVPNIHLRPLYGSALAYPMQVRDAKFDIFKPAMFTDDTIDWNDIDEARYQFLEAKRLGQSGVRASGDAAYALGWAYLQEGMDEEARFYFDKVRERPGNVKPVQLYLAAGQANLYGKNWDAARKDFFKAYNYGADEEDVVQGLAYISQATGVPSRADTGRLLASITSTPETLLLAGELLLMDGYAEESFEILEPLYVNHLFQDPEEANLDKMLRLRLGDAALYMDDIQKARLYWMHTFPDIKQVRMMQAHMLENGSGAWVGMVPKLRVLMEQAEPQISAEAMYLVGQVYSEYGTQLDAIELWSNFITTYPNLVYKTDVLDMLWVAYEDRISSLAAKENWSRIARTHEIGWVPELREYILGADTVINVANAYDKIGLSERALSALTVDFGVGMTQNFYGPEAELFLANLYFSSDRYHEAERTLDILRENQKQNAALGGDIQFLQAQIHFAQGQVDQAKTLFSKTALLPKYRTPSYVSLGILAKESGDCVSTVDYLQPILIPVDSSSVTDPLGYLYLAQCLGELGQNLEASEVAMMMQELQLSEDERVHAQYLQAKYGDPDAVDVQDTSAQASNTWINLIEELQESAKFDAEHKKWLESKQ